MRIEIWSDVICPWCWIGYTRFAKALAGFAAREDVSIVHRAFRLAPGEPVRPADQAISARYGMTVGQARAMMRQVEQTAAQDGLPFHLQGTEFGDTGDAHRLVYFATAQGRGHAMMERLWRAYFTENRSVFDHTGLTDLAVEVGLDRSAMQRLFEGRQYAEVVEADVRAAVQLGARGVPFFLIDGRLAIGGAQPVETFSAALEQAWREKPVLVGGDAERCGPGGCEI